MMRMKKKRVEKNSRKCVAVCEGVGFRRRHRVRNYVVHIYIPNLKKLFLHPLLRKYFPTSACISVGSLFFFLFTWETTWVLLKKSKLLAILYQTKP